MVDRQAAGWIVGVDGGGTGCRAAVADRAGKVLGRGVSGAANIMTDFAAARENILDSVRKAFAEAGLHEAGWTRTDAVLGLAGVNVGRAGERLLHALPFRRAGVETDALIALEGALGDGDGAIGIVGTGTAFLRRRAGALRPSGGWGFRLGDLGGGARLGQNFLEDTLLGHDGVRPGSPLSEAVLARFGGPQKLVEWAAAAQPRDFAGFAPEVFSAAEKSDALALRARDKAVAHLAESLRALGLLGGERLCLLGGLAPLMAPLLPADLRAFIHPAQADALSGALSLAVKRFGGGTPVSRVTNPFAGDAL
ncbi:MAG TPA: BadF/BadG/BcrA/BcrD ATPase family protein [Mesorhizobium sp.]|jgi:glucosamine kinase|nr:BadF/BadG/BcrA/BcrD ATPase family protein [Mesorhizobium sp.]